MQVVSFPARHARTHYRHELRTLTYVTLDAANGGIIRNLNSEGVAVQAVAPLRLQQRVRVRFELRFPRLRVDTHGQVSWAGASGQCGIRFEELPAETARQINLWIFSNLLDTCARHALPDRSIFGDPASIVSDRGEGANDGLSVSASARDSIRLAPSREKGEPLLRAHSGEELASPASDVPVDWLARPISGRTLAWLVDGLVVTAALLLFALIFLSMAHELPQWPLTVAATAAVAVFVSAAYWALFTVFGGGRPGVRLAQAASGIKEEDSG